MEKVKKLRESKTELTDKQKVFVAAYTDSSNPKTFLKKKAAMIAAGSKPSSAPVIANVISNKPKVKAAIIEALKKQKITPDYQAKRLKRLMEWTKPYFHEGVKIADVEDGEIQHKALLTSLKITDALDSLEKGLDEKGAGLSIHLAPELAERLVRIAAEMRMMREAHEGKTIPIINVKGRDNV